MKAKNGTRIFLCEITEERLILAVLACEKNNRRRFVDLEIQPLSGEGIEQRSRQLLDMLKVRRYAREQLIATVPHKYATSRFLRVPASSDEEIEKIVGLQAPRLLPASSDELVTGFQVISKEKDGFCRVNLIIVQKAVIDRYCALLQQAGVRDFSITLSSVGLLTSANLYASAIPGSPALSRSTLPRLRYVSARKTRSCSAALLSSPVTGRGRSRKNTGRPRNPFSKKTREANLRRYSSPGIPGCTRNFPALRRLRPPRGRRRSVTGKG